MSESEHETASHDAIAFTPDGELTIYTALSQMKQLMQVIAQQTVIEVDLSRVTEIDTAGLQLLVLAKLESLRRNLPLNISGHTRPVLDVIDLCNLSGFFGEPVFIPSDISARGHL